MRHSLFFVSLLVGCTHKSDSGTDADSGSDAILTSPYVGGWPFNPDKDEMGEGDWSTAGAVGAQVPHFTAVDQHGDMVDLYDFAGHGVPIVIDMGTIYCGPCKAIAAYLSTGDMSHLIWDPPEGAEPGYYPWWSEEYAGLRDMIANQEIFWITVLFNESTSGPSDQAECAEWDEAYPNPNIPVLADTNLELKTWLDIQSYPTLNLLNEDMVLEIHSTGGPYEVLRHLGDRMAAEN
jgi:thiol-disulfide isomerase/thioredoxin